MDSRVDFLGHFCFLFCIFHCNAWLLTSVVEINMNTPSASRGLSRVLGSVAWGIERLRAAAEQEITFGHEEHQEHQEHQGPQADLNGDGAVCSNSNRVPSDRAPAGDQRRSRDSRGSGGGGNRDTDNEFGSGAPAASGLPTMAALADEASIVTTMSLSAASIPRAGRRHPRATRGLKGAAEFQWCWGSRSTQAPLFHQFSLGRSSSPSS